MPEMLQVEIRPGCRLSAERALFLVAERMLVVADIHWGYAQSHRRAGNLLPLVGNEGIADRLRRLIAHYRPKRMLWLGDSLHTPDAAEIAEEFLEEVAPIEVIVLAGNHDRAWKRTNAVEHRLGNYFFHHGDKPREVRPGEIEVVGHVHPALAWYDGAGLRLKVPALVERHNRFILPSFSDWSSGAAWNDRLGEDEKLWLISPRKIWPLTRDQLSGRALPKF